MVSGLSNSMTHVKDALQAHVKKQLSNDEEEPFFICDLSHLTKKVNEWYSSLPRARPFYAVKCNPDPYMVRHLAQMGVGFDCASPAEMELVLGQGVYPSSIIYANPCKAKSAIKYARKHGISRMTFDNEAELHKIKAEFPDAQLVLRILADDETAICRLGLKFGASVDESLSLLDVAKNLQLDVVGISFHVGSGAKDVKAFDRAIHDARMVWDHAIGLAFDMKMLDIGGGFGQHTFATMAPAISSSLDHHFRGVACDIIAEPGRYFAEGAYTLGCSVIAQRRVRNEADSNKPPSAMLYLNDGVFGTFANCVYEEAQYVPHLLYQGSVFFPEDKVWSSQHHSDVQYSIWGPTCDSSDCINKGCQLGCVASVGDWLFFENMGAYSTACSTSFNGFSNVRKTIYVTSESKWDRKDSGVWSEDEGIPMQ